MNHSLVVRDRPRLLHRLMEELAGAGRMSLEGDLSRCRFTDDVVLARDELGALKRNTLQPPQDFVVLSLERETVESIFRQILTAGLSQAIVHVQIERGGVLQLGAYDHFHPECVFTGPTIRPALLAELKAEGILRGFGLARDSSW